MAAADVAGGAAGDSGQGPRAHRTVL